MARDCMKRSKQVCHSGKWKVSGFAYLMKQEMKRWPEFYRSMLDGRASLIITVDRPKARFGNRRLPAVSRPEASILKETIRPIVKRTGGRINRCMRTP